MPTNKQALIEQYRFCNVEHEDWEFDTIGRFKEWMAACGVELQNKDIQYSGFCSQGDGARFKTNIMDDDFNTFAELHGLYDAYPIMRTAYSAGCAPFIEMHQNNYGSIYCHDRTVYAEFNTENDFEDAIRWGIPEDDVRYIAAVALDEELSAFMYSEIEQVNEGITDQLRWYMRELYKALNTLYDDLTSDEVVWETILDNGWDMGIHSDE